MKVLVTGATGYIGGRLIPRLVESGHDVSCMARDPSRLEGRQWDTVEIRQGDVFDPDSLTSALDGIEVAYYLIHSMSKTADGFARRDRVAARNFADAAKSAGVQRIVYLGGLGTPDHDLSPHLASRQEVGNVLRESGIPVTEFRAAVVVGSGSVSFEMIRYLTERVPVMIAPKWVSTRCQPIAIANVLEYLVQCLEIDETAGRVVEIGGPDVLTYGEMMLGYARVRGLRRYMIPVPFLTPRLSSYWVDLVTPIPAAISRPLIEGLRSEVVVNDPEPARLFDIDLIPYPEAVGRALERTRADNIETAWSGAQTPHQPGVTLEEKQGVIAERRRVESSAPPSAVFAEVSSIGGRRGWYYADSLWKVRGILDRIVGGIGMRRGRRNQFDLRPGDALDFWRVEAVVPDQVLRLRAEMRVSGLAWLQFEVHPRDDGGSSLIQTAFYEPHGLTGVLYWYGLYPIHQLIFSGMAREIVRRAEHDPVNRSIREERAETTGQQAR
jgi:uncharacterized protein YbjT (DUF2867 family)